MQFENDDSIFYDADVTKAWSCISNKYGSVSLLMIGWLMYYRIVYKITTDGLKSNNELI